MSNVLTGSGVPVYYQRETDGFNSEPSSPDDIPFGANASMDQAEGSNNAVEVMEPATKTPIEIIEQAFEGSFSVTFDYTNPWWLAFLLGTPDTADNSDGTYTHAYSDENTASSHRILTGFESDGDARVLTGCVASQATIRPSVDQTGEVSIDGAYASEEPLGSAPSSQPTLQHSPMTFAEATLERGGSAVGYVQNARLQVPTNIRLIREFGSRISIDYAQHQMVPSINWTKITPADSPMDELEEMYGGTDGVSEDVSASDDMVLRFDNGVSAGSGQNTAAFNISGPFPDTVGQEQLGNPNETIQDSVNNMATGLSVDATNETADAL